MGIVGKKRRGLDGTGNAQDRWANSSLLLATATVQAVCLKELVSCHLVNRVDESMRPAVCNASGFYYGSDKSILLLGNESSSANISASVNNFTGSSGNQIVLVNPALWTKYEALGAMFDKFGACTLKDCLVDEAVINYSSLQPLIQSVKPNQHYKKEGLSKIDFSIRFHNVTTVAGDQDPTRTCFCAASEEGNAQIIMLKLRPRAWGVILNEPERSLLRLWAAIFEAGLALEEIWNAGRGTKRVCFVPDIRVHDGDGGEAIMRTTFRKLKELVEERDGVYGGRAVRKFLNLMEDKDPHTLVTEAFASEEGRLMLYKILRACVEINLLNGYGPWYQNPMPVSSGACRSM